MAVVRFEEILDGKGAQSQGPSQSQITRAFRVYSNEPFDTAAEIEPLLPIQWGSTLYDGKFVCRAVNYEFPHKGPGQLIANVTFTFKTESVDEEERERKDFPNPLDRRTRVSIRHVRYGKLSIEDRDGNIKRTSAGEIYPPKEVDATRYQFHFHKNYETIPNWVWDLQDKINEDSVQIRGETFDEGTLKFSLEEIPEVKRENGVKHFPIRWVLDWRREGWKDKRVDAGFYYMGSEGLTRMKDANDEDIVVEEWLDGSGGRLRDIIPNPQPGDETINEFDDYEEAAFSVMPLSEVESGDA